MTTAQNMLIYLAKKVKEKDRDVNTLNFLRECYKAWEGYAEDRYSYPAHQLRYIEKKYGMTIHDIDIKYR